MLANFDLLSYSHSHVPFPVFFGESPVDCFAPVQSRRRPTVVSWHRSHEMDRQTDYKFLGDGDEDDYDDDYDDDCCY